MKKYLSIIAVLLLFLTGCGTSETTLDETEQVDLTVMGWGFGVEGSEEAEKNVGRQIIDQYMEDNPNVNITLINPEEGENYNEYLMNLAAAGDLPDVFLYAGSTDPVTNGWALDLTDYVKNDEVFNSIHEAVRDGGMINDKIYGIPVAMHMGGIKYNETLFEKLNIEPLEYGFTMDEYMNAIKTATTDTTKGTTLTTQILDFYPPINDETIQWYNFDGEKYDYDNAAFQEALDYTTQIYNEALNEDSAEAGFFPEGSWPLGEGYIATTYDFTWWNMSDVPSGDSWKFVGLPGGSETITADYMYVSSTTEYPEWAIDFIEYYGAESYQTRYDIETAEAGLTSIPLTNDQTQHDLYVNANQEDPGLVAAFEDVISGGGHVEGNKFIPGESKSRYEADTGIINEETQATLTVDELLKQIAKGEKSFADYKDQLSEISNKEYETANALIV